MAIDPGTETARFLLQRSRYKSIARYRVIVGPSVHEYIDTVFPRNLAAPRIVAAFEISPRNSYAQCTKRRPRILAACGKGSSLLLRVYTYVILTLILNNAQCARSSIGEYFSRRLRNLAALEMSPRQTEPRN